MTRDSLPRGTWLARLPAQGLHLEWPLLVVAAPLLLFPGGWRTLGLLVVPLFFGLRWMRRKGLWEHSPLDPALLLLAVMLLVSPYATYSIDQSLPKIAGVLLGLLVFAAVVTNSPTQRTWQLHLAGLLLAGVGVAGLGLIGSDWLDKSPLLTRLTAALPQKLLHLPGAAEGLHPNEVAGALLWVTPMACALAAVAVLGARSLARSLGRLRGAILLAALVTTAAFLVGVLILTQSRGGWIAAALVLPVLLLVLVQGKFRRAAVVVMAASVIVAAVWIALARPSALDASTTIPQQDPSSGMSLETLSGRFEVWSRAIYGIQDFAFTGMGMNTFRRVVPVLYPLFSIDPTVDIGHAHNTFLQAALDLGLPGLIAYLAIHISAFAMLITTWRGRGQLPFADALSRALVLGLGGGLAAHLVYGLTDTVALGAKPGVLWWMLLGLVASLYRGLTPQAVHRTPVPAADA